MGLKTGGHKTLQPRDMIIKPDNCVLACFFQTQAEITRDYGKYNHPLTIVGNVTEQNHALLGDAMFFPVGAGYPEDVGNNYITIPHHSSLAITGDLTLYTECLFTDTIANGEVMGKVNLNGLIAGPYRFTVDVEDYGWSASLIRGNGVNFHNVVETPWFGSDYVYNIKHNIVYKMEGMTVKIFIGDALRVTGILDMMGYSMTDVGTDVWIGNVKNLSDPMQYRGYLKKLVLWDIALPDEECLRISKGGL